MFANGLQTTHTPIIVHTSSGCAIFVCVVFSSPGPKAHRYAYRIKWPFGVRPYVRGFSETTRPNQAKFICSLFRMGERKFIREVFVI